MYSNCLRFTSVATASPRRAASIVLKIRSVTPATADTTTIRRSCTAALPIISAHCRNLPASPTEVPPNFITISFLFIYFPLSNPKDLQRRGTEAAEEFLALILAFHLLPRLLRDLCFAFAFDSSVHKFQVLQFAFCNLFPIPCSLFLCSLCSSVLKILLLFFKSNSLLRISVSQCIRG